MKLGVVFFLVFAFFCPAAFCANTLYFPQVPYGGGYTTTFALLNTGTTPINSLLNLYSQSGVLTQSQPVSIAVGGSERYSLTGSSTLNVVYGILNAGTGNVDGVATFDLRTTAGLLTTTAGILGVAAGNSFVLPVDQTASTQSTGVAIANVLPSTAINVTLQLFNQDGTLSASAADVRLTPLGGQHQIADFVTSMFPQLAGASFQGTLVVQAAAGSPASSLAVAALTVKEGMLSALSVIPYTPAVTSATITTGNAPGSVTAVTLDNNTQSAGNSAGGLLNMACNVNGGVAFNSAAFWLCDSGKWRYALYKDFPPPPVGGYTTRPAWFPTVFSSVACPSGGVTFTQSVLPLDQLTASIPYGEMVYDHVTPIDHGYFGLKSLSIPAASLTESDYSPVVSPAAGVIIGLSSLGSPTSHGVTIDHGCGILSVYNVLNRPTGVLAPYASQVETQGYVPLSISVQAGDEFGRQRDNPLDFNVYDGNTWLSGLVPFSYASTTNTLFTSSPSLYFTPALASTYESYLQRVTSPRWGKIDDDVIGSAQGNWYLDGTLGYSCVTEQQAVAATKPLGGGTPPGKNSYAWCHLAVVPHWVQPDFDVASFGTWSDPAGDFLQFLLKVGTDQPRPKDLHTSSGTVVYEVDQITNYNPDGTSIPFTPGTPLPIGYTVKYGPRAGFVAMRVNADNTLTIETLPGATSAAAFTSFTSNQRLFRR